MNKKPKPGNEESQPQPQPQQPGVTAIPRRTVVHPASDFKERYPDWVGLRSPAKPVPSGTGGTT